MAGSVFLGDFRGRLIAEGDFVLFGHQHHFLSAGDGIDRTPGDEPEGDQQRE